MIMFWRYNGMVFDGLQGFSLWGSGGVTPIPGVVVGRSRDRLIDRMHDRFIDRAIGSQLLEE